MHKVESAIPLKYKNCRRVPRSENSSSTSIDNLIERINQDEEVPRMKLLQINYVNSSQKSANLPPNGANIHSRKTEDGCNGRPPLYKYAVYKKINGLESKIEDHSENHSKNRQLHEEKNMQCERTRKLEKRIRQRDVKCKSENLGTEKSGSWDFRTPPTEVFCKAPLRGVKTRASRIEQIEKISSSSNSGSSSRSSSGSNSSGVPPTHVPRSVPSDIARISKMFEQARRDNEEEDSLTRAHLSKVAGGGKIKRLVDNFENKCHCKDSSLSSNSSVSEPRRPDVPKLQSPKEPKLNIFPPPRSPRFDETNEKINQQIKQIFEKSSRRQDLHVQNRRDYSTRQQQHHHQTDHDRSSHQHQERNLQNQLEKHLKGRDRDVSPHQRRDLRSFDHSHNHLGRQRDSNGSGNQTRPPSGEKRNRNQSPHYHQDLRPQDQSPKMRGSSGIDGQNRPVKHCEGNTNQNLSPRRRSNDQPAKLRGSGNNNNTGAVTYRQDRLVGYHQSPEVPHQQNRGDRAPHNKDHTPRVQAKSPQNNPDRSNISERGIFPRDRQERSTNSNLLDRDRSRYHQQRDSSPHDQRVPLLGHREEERSMQQHHGRQRCPIELKKCAKSPTRPGDNVPQRHHKSVLEELAAEIQSKKMLKNRQQMKEQPLLVNCCDGTETEMSSGHTKPPVNQSNRDHSSKVRVSGLKEPQVHSAKLDKLDNQKQNGANDSKRNTCGYKNCTFNNCPMSPVTSQSGSGDDELVTKNKKLINCNSTCISPPPATKQDNIILESKKLEKSVKIMVNVSSGKLDECKEVSPPPPLHRPQPASLADTPNLSTKYSDLNDLQNFSGKNVTKATTNELLELNSSLNNTVAKNSKPKSNNIDVNLKNNENRKFNDLKSGSSPHSLKIFVRSSTCSASSKGSVSSETSSLTDSDYGYYDHVAESVNSTGVEADVVVPTEISVQSNKKSGSDVQIQSVFGSKLGCDGAIFWNNCYFYDDNNFCMTCTNENSSPDYEMNNRSRYVCVCPAKKVDLHDMRPRSMEGAIDSGVSINGDTGSSPDSDISSQHLQNQPDAEAKRLKRGHVLTELLETERIYVSEMCSILKGYRNQMLSEEMAPLVPPSLQGKEDILFGNLHELYTFHNDVFLKDLENCISTTELVALCFVQRRDTFYRLYSFYCQNIPRSERLRETLVDAHLFLQECQKRLGHKLPLAAYLLKPVQRITKYQLLLKDLLRFSDSGTCAKELQKALDCMLIVLKCVNDSMHQIAITGFPADLSQQGELLLQDSFQVWTESKKDIRLRLKTQQRHIFLYQKAMLFCKQGSKTGHNKSTYQYKHYVKMSQIGLTESVRGDPKRFEVWLQGRQEVHTLQAPTIEIKNKWVAEIKKVLLNQLEELKGEKIKQYGLNHKPLRQAASWDTPCPALSIPQRTMSCDTGGSSSDASNRNSNGSDECCPPQTPGISSSSSERGDNPDVSGWSSDYSNSEDELSMIEDSSTPGSRFVALADYCAVGHSEVSMKEGDSVELLKIGCAGWWFVKVLDSNMEGWTPAAYLEPTNRKSSRSSSRNQDRIN